VAYADQRADPINRDVDSHLWAVNVDTGVKRLISEGDAVEPSWSPHGHRIAFWSKGKTGARDIRTVSAEGGDSVSVTEDAALDWSPVWSPDGKFLYFLSNRGGTANLWRVAINEASGEVLSDPQPTNLPSIASDNLALSAEGKHLAYAALDRRRNLEKIRFDPQAGEVIGEPIAVTQGNSISAEPDVSPDGEWLVFDSVGGYEYEDILVVRTDGSGRRRITSDPDFDRQPKWSPDGGQIAFMSSVSGRGEIWTINTDGSGRRQLTDAPGHNIYPVWSPDGSRMGCWNQEDRTSYIFEPGKPWSEQTPRALPDFYILAWSPNGKYAAGWRVREGMAVYDLDRKEYQRVVNCSRCRSPRWLSDSRRLLLVNEGEIWLAEISSDEARSIFSLQPDTVESVAISPDNRTLYFEGRSDEADIWMLTFNEDQK
jgi:Tol biopolymer transport system component